MYAFKKKSYTASIPSYTNKNYHDVYMKSFRFFHRNYKSLMKKHPNRHVAILEGKVFDHDEDFEVLFKRLKDKNVNLEICVSGYVASEEDELIL